MYEYNDSHSSWYATRTAIHGNCAVSRQTQQYMYVYTCMQIYTPILFAMLHQSKSIWSWPWERVWASGGHGDLISEKIKDHYMNLNLYLCQVSCSPELQNSNFFLGKHLTISPRTRVGYELLGLVHTGEISTSTSTNARPTHAQNKSSTNQAISELEF